MGDVMKYTREERFEIGKEIFEQKMSSTEIVMKYGIAAETGRRYKRFYLENKDSETPPPPQKLKQKPKKGSANSKPKTLEELEQMSKEELIQEVMNSRIREARAKKGYEVKGVGVDKEFPNLDNKNTK